jgi:hypothetical protein
MLSNDVVRRTLTVREGVSKEPKRNRKTQSEAKQAGEED